VVAIPSFWDERKLLVFIALIIVASAAMLLEVDAVRNGRQSIVDEISSSILSPIEGAVTRVAGATGTELYTMTHAGSIAARDAALAQRVAQLAADAEKYRGVNTENAELRKMLAMRAAADSPSVAAEVVGYTPESGRKEITIDRGSRDGVKRDDVVVSGTGLVGHVVDVGPREAHVLLAIDETSAVPAYLLRTRAWGIVIGTSLHVKMKYIGQDEKVIPGDTVVTGRGQVYPGGIPIGRVREVDRKDSALYQTAILDAYVDFGSLTDVLVLKTQ
jgi:rod shape-determining protein MreC